MARTEPVNFEPHLVALDKDGNRCETRERRLGERNSRLCVGYAVVMKTGPGEYEWLTEMLSRSAATREMRRIREDMAQVWLASRVPGQSARAA